VELIQKNIFITDQAPSGVAPIWVDSKGENAIIVVPGANALLSEEEVESCRSLIASSSFLACQLEIDPVVSLKALKIAKEEGVTTIFNPAPMQENLSSEFLLQSDIVCLNQTETETLTGLTINNEEDEQKAAKQILEKGPKHVILTLGSRGCLLLSKEQETNIIRISSPKVQVVDTTGAGDSFVGSMLYALSTGKDLESAVRWAVEIAAISVTNKGTQSSYPSRKNLPLHLQ